MRKLDGNRILAHSGGNALDRTVAHIAGYLLAGLAQLVIRTDVAGSCAHHSNQVVAVFLSSRPRLSSASAAIRWRSNFPIQRSAIS